MLKQLAKTVPLSLGIMLALWMSIGLHEQLHYVVGNQVGVHGYVTYGWLSGRFHHAGNGDLTTFQQITTGLAGGMGVALMFLLIWLAVRWQSHYSKWLMVMEIVCLVTMCQQGVYSIGDALKWHPALFSNGGMLVGYVAAILIYGKRVYYWLLE